MLETILAAETAKIVLDVLNKVTDGALNEVGVQILQYLTTQFKENFQLSKVKEDPGILEVTVLDKALKDKNFKNELEQLVLKFQKIENSTAQVIQKNIHGQNISAQKIENSNLGQIFRNQ